MTCGVYAIFNRNNNHAYVGSSINIEERWRNHRQCLKSGRHHAPKLLAAWSRDGAEAFLFEVLELADQDDLCEREQHWMDALEAYGTGYNGRPTANKHGLLPELTKQRMSVGSKRAGLDPDLRKLRSERAKAQHASGNLGRATWTSETYAQHNDKLKAAWVKRRTTPAA